MRRSYLLPLLAFIPLMIAVLTLTKFEYSLTPLTIGVLIGVYFIANITYSVARKTFHISILVELSIVAMIGFYILTNLL